MNPEYPFQPSQQPSQAPQPNQSYIMPGYGPQPAPQQGYTPIPPANLPPVKKKPSKLLLIFTIVFAVLALAGIGVAIWAYVNYLDQKNNVDSKITVAVADATKEQADKLAADFIEAEKEPKRLFVGPDDYGRLEFKYPKTWSLYVPEDASNRGDYEAYFNPGLVPSIEPDNQLALRVLIQNEDYDQVVGTYTKSVESGELTSSSVKIGEQNGTRLDGKFSDDIKGYAVIFKIRDKTVVIRSDAETFKTDFEALIPTITFVK